MEEKEILREENGEEEHWKMRVAEASTSLDKEGHHLTCNLWRSWCPGDNAVLGSHWWALTETFSINLMSSQDAIKTWGTKFHN